METLENKIKELECRSGDIITHNFQAYYIQASELIHLKNIPIETVKIII